jgi:hypothetical protein
MQLLTQSINRKLGITRFDSRTFGVLARAEKQSDASAPSIRWPAIIGPAQLEPEWRHGAASVSFAGLSV